LLKEKEFVGAFRTPEGMQQEEDRIAKALRSVEIEETAIKSGARAVRNLPGVTPEEANTAIAARARETGNLNAQLKGLDLQKFGTTAISQASVATQAISNAQDYFKNIKDTQEIEASRYKLTEEFVQLSKAQQLEKSEQFRQETAEIDAIISSLEKRKAVASALIALDSARALKNPELIAAAEGGLATAEQQYSTAYNLNREQETLNKTVASRAILIADEVARLSSASDIYKQYFADQTLGLQQQEDTLQLKQAQLAQDLERGKISQDEFNAAKYLYDTEQAGITRANALLAEQEKYTKTILDIKTKIAEAGGESPEQTRQLQQAKVDTDAATAAIRGQYEQTLKLRDLNKELAERQQGYADAFGRAFDGMTDAIVNFAKTGKLSFTDMISSFIEDLIRLEIKQMQMQFIQGSGGLTGLATQVFGAWLGSGGTGTGGTGMGLGNNAAGAGSMRAAKGAAFDTGVQAFAKGGAFTNSVVSSPTLFKFAKGTGLMGEAGPEAIMPLKRDNSGNLGVRAQGGGAKVDVVVNNFGSEKAETRETVDSRGNRKIEVVIGEMVAGETARSGSPQQRVLGGTFGLRPQLIRR
jgi:lambda family phage tail tape measure protein